MTKTKATHTPGPWNCENSICNGLYVVSIGNGLHPIAQINHAPHETTMRQIQADGSLIAAILNRIMAATPRPGPKHRNG